MISMLKSSLDFFSQLLNISKVPITKILHSVPMAPTSQAEDTGTRDSRNPVQFPQLYAWLDTHGDAEYALYQERNPSPSLNYFDWAASDIALGAYFYHVSASVWDALSSSSEDSDDSDAEEDEVLEMTKPESVVSGAPVAKPKKTQKAASATSKKTRVVPTGTASASALTKGSTATPKQRKSVTAKHAHISTSREMNGSSTPKQTNSAIALNTDTNTFSYTNGSAKSPQQISTAPTESVISAPAPLNGSSTAQQASTGPIEITANTPSPADGSSTPKRALRIRTPAQQKPYSEYKQRTKLQRSAGKESPREQKLEVHSVTENKPEASPAAEKKSEAVAMTEKQADTAPMTEKKADADITMEKVNEAEPTSAKKSAARMSLPDVHTLRVNGDEENYVVSVDSPVPKRKRGRPKKNSLEHAACE
ncbi:hypothetical protein GQ43DRAFT_481491 [Delitschia confertaspora ATCC 74209]|uniref:Uncharacterized protein n=1 Tax=Delitschia confertaspora ATCC 74209 TaxID=1513339 RepID=A0A9P4JP93_9PLEO|nr:hypothetical protein GQ43DRAFT_481491 [Delitschia confertaspora ATCC 74209]